MNLEFNRTLIEILASEAYTLCIIFTLKFVNVKYKLIFASTTKNLQMLVRINKVLP